MNDDFLAYYQKELSDLRTQGQKFAETYPKIADRLKLGHAEIEDPFVARLLESVAFLTARINQKIDFEHQSTINDLISLLYPTYLMPIPAASILQYQPDAALDKRYQLKRDTVISTATPKKQLCHFTTTYDVTVYPLTQTSVSLSSTPPVSNKHGGNDIKSALTICLNSAQDGLDLQAQDLEKLRYYLNLPLKEAFMLYELIFKDLSHIVITSPDEPNQAIRLPASLIQPVGFSHSDAILPTPKQGFEGYRLLLEFFTTPQKLLFFDIVEIANNLPNFCKQNMHIHLMFKNRNKVLESKINTLSLMLNCTPILNLFNQVAEPIQFNKKTQDYHVIADAHTTIEDIEIVEIQKINVVNESVSGDIKCSPYFGRNFNHTETDKLLYWQPKYKPCSQQGFFQTAGFECYVTFSELNFNSPTNTNLILTPYVKCTNRQLTHQLPHGKQKTQFHFRHQDHELIKEMYTLIDISTPKYWPQTTNHKIKLLSHLNLNQFSLHDPETVIHSLKSMLNLYNFGDSKLSEKIVDSITDLTAKHITIRHPDKLKQGFCQGTQVDLTIDESFLHNQETLLFSKVLHEFLSLSCSINSFIKLSVISMQRGKIIDWKPKLGTKETI